MASRGLEKMPLSAGRTRSVERVHQEAPMRRRLLKLVVLLASLAFLAHSQLGPRRQMRVVSNSSAAPATRLLMRNPATFTTATSAAAGTVLECFQVALPVLTQNGSSYESTSGAGSFAGSEIISSSSQKSCSVLLMDRVFASSYGVPFIGNYTPPSCEFNRVVMNFTVVSEGRQFDRLALMYFGDTEVWRTSTAEPTTPPGIRWTYMKDMTQFLYLWKSPQTLIFDLGNVIDDTYTGSFNTTLTATFFTSDVETDAVSPADLIIPISARKGASEQPSAFILPTDNATNVVSFPRNVNRAVFSIAANGQASEEFWWSNVLQSDINAFNQTAAPLPGLSPFREVQVLIDGQLAGVWWPFPVVFTGGVSPGLHRPIVGLDAFDLREHEIDISPWLSVLCDGAKHNFTILVAGLNDDGRTATLTQTVNSNWVVSGKVFAWLDDEGSVTTGTPPSVEVSDPTITFSHAVAQNSTGFNETLTFNVAVQRLVSVKATINSQGKSGEASWSQTLSYTNDVHATDFGFDQVNDFLIQGVDSATSPSAHYDTDYGYPLYCDSRQSVDPVQGNITMSARLVQGLNLYVEGNSVFPTGLEVFAAIPRTENTKFTGSLVNTSRDGTASFSQTGDGKSSSGYGSTMQVFHFGGFPERGSLGNTPDVELYFRNASAVNGTVVYDFQTIATTDSSDFSLPAGEGESGDSQQAVFAGAPVRGKGPGAFTR
ncbi:peptide N-acetyl-beta-D-glucosaminyl asparaginase amidase A-domain-containing protein [Xylariales sp. AK1849]|nr:peptide N-acetyl-beta-D-glucosaminyl asparaginase amidase A-domain-containing protein [Xylariales sp. AK1849]